MLNFQLRCIKRINSTIGNNSILDIFGSTRYYSKDKGSCCKDIDQFEGKRVEEWPKCDPPPPAWRGDCPQEPQPPNYDPYRIKVPDIVVPPLPPSNAKEIPSKDSRDLFNGPEISFSTNVCNEMRDLFYNSPIIHPDYWKEKPSSRLPNLANEVHEPLRKLGYHGKHKYKYAFHEPWKPLDRLTLLAEAEKEELDETQISYVEKTDEQLN